MSRLMSTTPLAKSFKLVKRSCSKSTSQPQPAGATAVATKEEQTETVESIKRKAELIKNNPDKQIHWEYSQDMSTSHIYDKKPIKLKCTAGRVYMW